MYERVTLRPGALVIGRDGGLGNLEGVVVRPDGRAVLGLLLREGLLVDRRIVIPLSAVEEADDNRVQVSLDRADLNVLYAARIPRIPDAPPTDVPDRSDAREGPDVVGGVTSAEPAPLTHVLRAGQTVVCRDGDSSPLILVLVDGSSARITGLVVQRSGPAGRPVIVPAEWVTDSATDPIVLDAACEHLDGLPDFRSDEEISDAVIALLWHGSDLDRADLNYVTVRTRDGIVELDGKTRTERARMEIDQVARDVRGVLDVKNRLRTFEALDAAVRRFGDERLSGNA
ncbi:MAG: BON domain-containing protein [Chloroflexi bacterium]|nr:BON domain-containing protein [Chloroflexota bacterium]